jgi:hypothetical protein
MINPTRRRVVSSTGFSSWFNTLLKAVVKDAKTLSEDGKQELINNKLREIFSNNEYYKLCLLELPDNFSKKDINKLETILRSVLDPLNKIIKRFDLNMTLKDLIKITASNKP